MDIALCVTKLTLSSSAKGGTLNLFMALERFPSSSSDIYNSWKFMAKQNKQIRQNLISKHRLFINTKNSCLKF